jgi:hypothetical protein
VPALTSQASAETIVVKKGDHHWHPHAQTNRRYQAWPRSRSWLKEKGL